MAETSDYNPGIWKGRDSKKSRTTYDSHVGRSYSVARQAKIEPESLVPEFITTDSSCPLVILCDVTGSMGSWPATIFSKLPYLELEGKEYLGEDMEIAWGAIGDATCDKYPLQIRPFSKGLDLDKQLQQIVVEGGGGGGAKESYELAALYVARNVYTPKAEKPLCIIIGDEGFYDIIPKADATKVACANFQTPRVEAREIFQELMERFSVYLIRKPYDLGVGDQLGPRDKVIQAQWERVLGAERIVHLPNADRVVDVIFGILAKEKDRVEYFREELSERQEAHQVETVMKSLIHMIADEVAEQMIPDQEDEKDEEDEVESEED